MGVRRYRRKVGASEAVDRIIAKMRKQVAVAQAQDDHDRLVMEKVVAELRNKNTY